VEASGVTHNGPAGDHRAAVGTACADRLARPRCGYGAAASRRPVSGPAVRPRIASLKC